MRVVEREFHVGVFHQNYQGFGTALSGKVAVGKFADLGYTMDFRSGLFCGGCSDIGGGDAALHIFGTEIYGSGGIDECAVVADVGKTIYSVDFSQQGSVLIECEVSVFVTDTFHHYGGAVGLPHRTQSALGRHSRSRERYESAEDQG